MKAYCWRSGQIELVNNRVTLPGAFLLAKAPAQPLRNTVNALARHAYDGKTLLCPGVPEASDGASAVDAVIKFRTWLQTSLTKHQAQRTNN